MLSVSEEEVHRLYGGHLRVRACGILVRDEQVLMVRHRGISSSGDFWAPPGGAIQFGEPAARALQREFAEETSLEVTVGRFLFIHEFIRPPLHALELFFAIEEAKGAPQAGTDPEMFPDHQLIAEVKYMTLSGIRQLPAGAFHSFFSKCSHIDDVFKFQGYIAASD